MLPSRLAPALCVLLLLVAACAEGLPTEPAAAAADEALALDALLGGSAPDVIPLPDGFQPEGIVIGRGPHAYVGSLGDGRIYRASLRTGEGAVLVAPPEGRIAVGLDLDERSGLLWVAGGPTGEAYVYDAATGRDVAAYDLGGAFVNDVIVTREAAYFTDSFRPVLYRVPLGPGGRPGDTFDALPLGGDFQFLPGEFNANGIAATPDGRTLLVVNASTGTLYAVAPATGAATAIQGVSTPSGDGLVLDGPRTLYVVQNFFNKIAEVRLSPDLATATLVAELTDPAFRIPTTADDFGRSLYAVNARFDLGIPAPPGTAFEIVRVRK